ncbi:MAG: PqqD family protein [Clostridia bacterium]|nr:PqqD family protein [Clostridia bacterium]MBR0510478.1 PqqD family protein [Clostridia bacterium]MBR0537614.1 PqqD family protein [Clostridia bacterium]
MKLSEDFICRKVCGETLLMPIGEKTKEFNGIFTLSETGALLIDAIVKGENADGAAALLAEQFAVDIEIARQDTLAFFEQLQQYGILLDDDAAD